MPFGEGHEKIGGRAKGSVNKITKAKKDFFQRITECYEQGTLNNFAEDWGGLTAKDRMTAYLAMCEYIIPKLARQEITDGDGNPVKLLVVRDAKSE